MNKRVPVSLFWVKVLVPNWAIGQSPFPRVVLMKLAMPFEWRLAVCAHELQHVLQWERLGFWGFLTQYAREWRRYGYHAMPLEGEARAAEYDPWFLAWAADVLAGG